MKYILTNWLRREKKQYLEKGSCMGPKCDFDWVIKNMESNMFNVALVKYD